MKIDFPLLYMLAAAAVVLIAYLIWRNLTDVKDNDPDLTDELERQARKKPKDRG